MARRADDEGRPPPRRQRDAYEALAILNSLVGTQGVYDTALNLATELSRGFHLGAGMSSNGRESQGLLCYGADMSSGRRFGAGGPRGEGTSLSCVGEPSGSVCDAPLGEQGEHFVGDASVASLSVTQGGLPSVGAELQQSA
ncbi:hypothetical protein MRX96_050129 [Rhipicephalus microplus]